jgi:hypothetical protein
MRQFRLIRIAAVTVAALVLTCSAVTGDCRSPKSKEYLRDMTVPVPQFSIAVTLSENARLRLQSMHESVLVIAYFDGDPLPGQGRDNAPFRDVFLGKDEKMVDDHNVATFDTTNVSQSNWNRLADKNYFVTINVVSARKASKNNLLSCGVPEDRLNAFAGKTTQVSCNLIGEHNPSGKSIEDSALKSVGSSPK